MFGSKVPNLKGRYLPWIGVVAMACAKASSPETEAPQSHAPSPVEGEEEKKASSPPTTAAPKGLTLDLRGHDGRPLRGVHLSVSSVGRRDAFVETDLATGTASIELPDAKGEALFLRVSAVDHAESWRQVLPTAPLRISGRLGTYARRELGDEVAVRGTYHDAEGKVVGQLSGTARRSPQNRYRLELTDRPATATELRYQLSDLGAGGRTFNGPTADRFTYDGGGDFLSVTSLAGLEALELDLGALPPAGVAQNVVIEGIDPHFAAVDALIHAWHEKLNALLGRGQEERKASKRSKERERALAATLATESWKDVEAEQDPARRNLLRAAFAGELAMFLGPERLETEVRWVLANLPADDPRWPAMMNLMNQLYHALTKAPTMRSELQAYYERMAETHPSAGQAAGAIAALLHLADQRNDEAAATRWYERLSTPRFASTDTFRFERTMRDPNRVLQPGQVFPAFDFAGLDGTSRVRSDEFRGRYVFLEFWATWCGPCVGEMEHAHRAYARINAKKTPGTAALRRLRPARAPKVEFVFVSMDPSAEVVQRFREREWSMPWRHALVAPNEHDEIYKRYGFQAVPTGVLLDPHGKIVRVFDDLRGSKLIASLEAAIGTAP